MYIIAVDENRSDLLTLKAAIKEAVPNCVLSCFTNSQDALSCAKVTSIDVAYIDPKIDGGNGFRLAGRLIKKNSRTSIVFINEGVEYARSAFVIFTVLACDYKLKPITAEKVAHSLEFLRQHIKSSWEQGDEPFFTVKTKDSDITVQFSSIMCIEYSKRIATFEVEGFDSLYSKVLPWHFGKVIAPLLKDERFLKVSNKCVINMDWIDKVTDNSFVIFADLEVNIPKNVYVETKEKYNNYYSLRVRQGIFDDDSKEN